MDYRLGNSKKVNEFGLTSLLECPKCKEEVQMSVFTNLDTFFIPKLPLVKMQNVYLLVCPKCAGLFTADVSKDNIQRKNKILNLNTSDLKELEKYE